MLGNTMANGANYFNIVSTKDISPFAQRVHSLLTEKKHEFGFIPVERKIFASGEPLPVLEESIRYKSIYVFHSLAKPDSTMSFVEMQHLLDAIGRASPDHVTLVLPYVSYLRQDRKGKAREPISASVMADAIKRNNVVGRLITIDLHYEQFPSLLGGMPVDHLEADMIYAPFLSQRMGDSLKDLVVAPADGGGQKRNRRLYSRLKKVPGFGIAEKLERVVANESEMGLYAGDDPRGKNVLTYEDILDTCGTMQEFAVEMRRRGANDVYVAATHGLLNSKGGIEATARLRQSNIRAFITNTVPHKSQFLQDNSDVLEVVDAAPLFARAIFENSYVGGSVSQLFRTEDFDIPSTPRVVMPWST